LICHLRSSIKTPAREFKDWASVRFEQLDEQDFDDDKFELILQKEANDIINSKTEAEREEAYKNAT
jgi:hypothetical protein